MDQASEVTATATTLGLTNKYRQPALKPSKEIKDIYFRRDADSDNEEDLEDLSHSISNGGDQTRRLSLDSDPPEVPPSFEDEESDILPVSSSAPSTPAAKSKANGTSSPAAASDKPPKRKSVDDEEEVPLDDVM